MGGAASGAEAAAAVSLIARFLSGHALGHAGGGLWLSARTRPRSVTVVATPPGVEIRHVSEENTAGVPGAKETFTVSLAPGKRSPEVGDIVNTWSCSVSTRAIV